MMQLDARLKSVADLVPAAQILLDVGCDHAYLPIYLCEKGIIASAVASDINEGPLEAARGHIANAGLGQRITTVLSDGIAGLEYIRPDVISICGMGGELIRDILQAADWVRDGRILLIFQPMTHAQDLRLWLSRNGFAVEKECLSCTDRIYQAFSARYTGVPYDLSLFEQYYGKDGIRDGTELYRQWMLKQYALWDKKRCAKAGSGQDTSEEDIILKNVKERL